ncbi:Uncharacterised protein [Chryseobacterium taklimakanense]|uniref:Uncharacterized protein n=1 Tax=Chryseobacterium taklimakanense TaxID=536441 RepID=A0A239WMC4_9FLAO|nr:hypothetical protein [Chryseobacterium taklimakanense]SNV35250.1 Uncharacterised protein [Chryseobacterium taklimakanense]
MDFSLRYYKTETLISFLVILVVGISSNIPIVEGFLIKHNLSFISLPSITLLISLIFLTMEKWLHLCPPIWKYFMKVPYIGGKYKGKINFVFIDSKGTENAGEKVCEMNIYQTPSKIKISSKFYYEKDDEKEKQTTYSESYVELLQEIANLTYLHFAYENGGVTINNEVPKATGFNTLKYDKEEKSLQGEYFSQRVASRNGNIYVKKI